MADVFIAKTIRAAFPRRLPVVFLYFETNIV